MTTHFEISDLHHHFRRGRIQVFNDASMIANKGEIIGLFGRNGTGKSTLFKILFGILKAKRIRIIYEGQIFNPSKNIQSRFFGYLPQHTFLPYDMLIKDMIHMLYEHKGDINAIFKAPDMYLMEDLRLGDLSTGMRKYIEFQVLFHLDHPVLLLDEPYAMLEPKYKQILNDMIARNPRNKTILIADHYYNDVVSVAKRIMVIADEKIHEVNNAKGLVKYGYLSEKMIQ